MWTVLLFVVAVAVAGYIGFLFGRVAEEEEQERRWAEHSSIKFGRFVDLRAEWPKMPATEDREPADD